MTEDNTSLNFDEEYPLPEVGEEVQIQLSNQRAQKFGQILNNYLDRLNPNILKDYQQERMRSIANALTNGDSNGYVRMPTRTGKAWMYGHMIKAFLEAKESGDIDLIGTKIVVSLPKRTGVNDIYSTLINPDKLDIPKEQVGRYHTNVSVEEKLLAPDKDVLIITNRSLIKLVEKDIVNPANTFMSIPDEVHRSTGPRMSETLEPFMQTSLVLGWTASDYFANGENVSERLFYGKKPMAEMDYVEAVNRNALTPVINYILETNIELGDVKISQGDYSKSDLEDKILKKGLLRDYSSLKFLQKHVDPQTGIKLSEQKTHIFASGIEHANRLEKMAKKMFGEENVICIHSGLDDIEYQKREKRIFEEKPKYVISVDMLLESVTLPEYSVALMLRPTMSPVVEIQGPGRVLGLNELNPLQVAFVINALDKDTPNALLFGNLAGGFHIMPEKGSEKYIKNPSAEPIAIALDEMMTDDEYMHDVELLGGLFEEGNISAEIRGIIKDKDSLSKYSRAVKMHHNKREVAEFYEQYQIKLQGLKLSRSGLPDDYIVGLTNLTNFFGSKHRENLKAIHNDLMEQFLSTKEPELNGEKIDVVMLSAIGRSTIAYSPSAIEKIASLYNIDISRNKDRGLKKDHIIGRENFIDFFRPLDSYSDRFNWTKEEDFGELYDVIHKAAKQANGGEVKISSADLGNEENKFDHFNLTLKDTKLASTGELAVSFKDIEKIFKKTVPDFSYVMIQSAYQTGVEVTDLEKLAKIVGVPSNDEKLNKIYTSIWDNIKKDKPTIVDGKLLVPWQVSKYESEEKEWGTRANKIFGLGFNLQDAEVIKEHYYNQLLEETASAGWKLTNTKIENSGLKKGWIIGEQALVDYFPSHKENGSTYNKNEDTLLRFYKKAKDLLTAGKPLQLKVEFKNKEGYQAYTTINAVLVNIHGEDQVAFSHSAMRLIDHNLVGNSYKTMISREDDTPEKSFLAYGMKGVLSNLEGVDIAPYGSIKRIFNNIEKDLKKGIPPTVNNTEICATLEDTEEGKVVKIWGERSMDIISNTIKWQSRGFAPVFTDSKDRLTGFKEIFGVYKAAVDEGIIKNGFDEEKLQTIYQSIKHALKHGYTHHGIFSHETYTDNEALEIKFLRGEGKIGALTDIGFSRVDGAQELSIGKGDLNILFRKLAFFDDRTRRFTGDDNLIDKVVEGSFRKKAQDFDAKIEAEEEAIRSGAYDGPTVTPPEEKKQPVKKPFDPDYYLVGKEDITGELAHAAEIFQWDIFPKNYFNNVYEDIFALAADAEDKPFNFSMKETVRDKKEVKKENKEYMKGRFKNIDFDITLNDTLVITDKEGNKQLAIGKEDQEKLYDNIIGVLHNNVNTLHDSRYDWGNDVCSTDDLAKIIGVDPSHKKFKELNDYMYDKYVQNKAIVVGNMHIKPWKVKENGDMVLTEFESKDLKAFFYKEILKENVDKNGRITEQKIDELGLRKGLIIGHHDFTRYTGDHHYATDVYNDILEQAKKGGEIKVGNTIIKADVLNVNHTDELCLTEGAMDTILDQRFSVKHKSGECYTHDAYGLRNILNRIGCHVMPYPEISKIYDNIRQNLLKNEQPSINGVKIQATFEKYHDNTTKIKFWGQRATTVLSTYIKNNINRFKRPVKFGGVDHNRLVGYKEIFADNMYEHEQGTRFYNAILECLKDKKATHPDLEGRHFSLIDTHLVADSKGKLAVAMGKEDFKEMAKDLYMFRDKEGNSLTGAEFDKRVNLVFNKKDNMPASHYFNNGSGGPSK